MLERIQELRKREWNMPLSRRVAETLLSYDGAYRSLSIEARGNVVILTGYAVDEESHTIALEVAQATQGVAEVIDRIIVRRRHKAPRLTALDIPLTTETAGPPLWQRAAVPVTLCGLLVLIVHFSWQSLPSWAGSPVSDDFYVVEGSVFIDGRPAAGAELTFYPRASVAGAVTTRPKAVVGPDGRFSVETPDEGPGAPAGCYVVTARLPSQVAATAGDVLPSRYADPRSSPLSAEIVPANVVSLPPFELARVTNAIGKAS